MKNIFFIVVLTIFTVNTHAQTFGFSNSHISFIVKDIKKSADFYKGVMQLEEMVTPVGMPETVRWFILSDGTEIHITEATSKFKTPQKEIYFSFATNDLLEFVNLLVTKKIPFEDWFGEKEKVTTRSDGIKQFYFQDPDGYWIQVNNNVK